VGFPFDQYDIIILDSIDSFTEGCGEKDSSRISLALAPLLDVVRRPNGPAVLMLGNVLKDGRAGRGSGVVEDRADIVFEVRDATGFHPSGKKPWWEELPPAGRGDWAAATTRRRGKDKPARIRVAFINSKFRVGEEPDPSVLEVDFAGDPWTVEDVTTTMVAEGDAAVAAALAERQRKLGDAAGALVAEISRRERAGQAPFTFKVSEAWLEEKGLTDKGCPRAPAGAEWQGLGHPTALDQTTPVRV
jgi:hypothetical protein